MISMKRCQFSIVSPLYARFASKACFEKATELMCQPVSFIAV